MLELADALTNLFFAAFITGALIALVAIVLTQAYRLIRR